MLHRLVLTSLVLSVAAPARAQTPPVDLSAATLEDLMNIEITSASRKEQRAGDVPAAVYIITRDDIRRSGMTSVPDLLRLVPGVQVAQINSNKWAVSVRGFNSLYSNKLWGANASAGSTFRRTRAPTCVLNGRSRRGSWPASRGRTSWTARTRNSPATA